MPSSNQVIHFQQIEMEERTKILYAGEPRIDSFLGGFQSSRITLIDSRHPFSFDMVSMLCVSAIKDLEYYSQLNNNLACLLQLKNMGLRVRPGEHVKYIITDAESRRYNRKVKAWQLTNGNERYDKKKYLTHLFRAGESILSPFGYTERKIADIIRPTQQLTLTF